MSEPIYFILGIHHHQPVGNFDDVFSKAFECCYRPFLDALERHPAIKVSLHHSGPLLDWALEREGNYLERVTSLAKKGQIEILGGGYYEPILPILKPSDALGQIEMMQKFWEKNTGKRPSGMWLAERVWEPSLAALLFDAKMDFTILDDQHFRHAGITAETLFGYYRTERAGKPVSIFPSDKLLRYMIPFKQPEEVVGHLLYLQEKHPGKSVTYGDDGEKFGMWPGTYDWVIKQGWLDKFLTALENAKGRVETITFSEYMSKCPPSGHIYLPTASYSEMLEWAMPADAIINYERSRKAIESCGLWDKAAPFFRGGFWDNFLTKYPESNLIHKRAIYVSDKIDAAEKKGHKLAAAKKALYRAQCNCAYWHGLFGGLYLNYLRHALYHNLIDAELAVDCAVEGGKSFSHIELVDLDLDGQDEAILANETLSCIIKAGTGGALASLDFRPKRFNLLNTLARRFEAYHEPKGPPAHVTGGNIPSIHDLSKDIGELRNILVYDRAPRYAFLDHSFNNEPDWQSILDGRYSDQSGFDTLPYKLLRHKKDSSCVKAAVTGEIAGTKGNTLAVEKEYCLGEAGRLNVHYKWKHHGNGGPPVWLATEFSFTLLAGHDAERYYQWNGVKPGTVLMDEKRIIDGISSIDAVDKAFGFRLHIEADAQKTLISPIETVSQSEKGFDRMYQGSTIWLAFKPKWSNLGETKFSVGILIEKI